MKDHPDESCSCTDVVNNGFLKDVHMLTPVSCRCVLHLTRKINVADGVMANYPTFNSETTLGQHRGPLMSQGPFTMEEGS